MAIFDTLFQRWDDILVTGVVVPLLGAIVVFLFQQWVTRRYPGNHSSSIRLVGAELRSEAQQPEATIPVNVQTPPKRQKTSSFKLFVRVFACVLVIMMIAVLMVASGNAEPSPIYGIVILLILAIAAFNLFRLFLRGLGVIFRGFIV